jgi:hypothetical protein
MCCPACYIDLGTPLNEFVKEGDLSFCPGCGAMMVIGGNLEMRMPTQEEADAVRADPQVRYIEFVIKMQVGARNRQNN